jgi:hypothetical protein
MQGEAQDALSVFPSGKPSRLGPVEQLATLPLGIAARPLYSDFARSWLTGSTTPQRAGDLLLRKPETRAMIDALRGNVRAAQLGAATTD